MGKKLSELTPHITSLSSEDLIYVAKKSGGSYLQRPISADNFSKSLVLTEDTAPTSADLLVMASGEKVQIGNLFRNLPDGTAAAPSLAFASDSDTGLYWISSKRAGYGIDGVQKFGFYERTALDGLGVTEEVGGGAFLVYGSTVGEYTMLSHYIFGATLTTKNAHSQLEIDVWNGSAFESVGCFRCPGVDARGLQIRNAGDTDGINIYCCHPTYGGNYINMSEVDDAIIATDGANIICLKNGVNAQTFRWYGTWTDASNYEGGYLTAAAGLVTLGARTLGTGTDNIDVKLIPTGTGKIIIPDGAIATPALVFNSDTNTGLYWLSSGNIGVSSNGVLYLRLADDGFTLRNNAVLGWTDGDPYTGSRDVLLWRDAGNILALKNGVNAQTLRIYTTTDYGGNYEYGSLAASAGLVTLSAGTLGTGTDNIDIALIPIGTGNVKFGTYAAKGAEAFDGYITIKDAAGNSRKIMTCA